MHIHTRDLRSHVIPSWREIQLLNTVTEKPQGSDFVFPALTAAPPVRGQNCLSCVACGEDKIAGVAL